MRHFQMLAAAVVATIAWGCGDGDRRPAGRPSPATARKIVVWLDHRGLDEITAAMMQRIGVDQVVVRRGSVDLAGAVPVVRFEPRPEVPGGMPAGVCFELQGAREGLDQATAEAVWRAIAAEEGGASPAEIILDMPELPEGIAAFVGALARVSGTPVFPLLSVDQLDDDEARHAVGAAGGCIVPVSGTGHPSLRGVAGMSTAPLSKKLEPLADLPARVRLAISLAPVTDPAVVGWGDDLGPLTEPETADVTTSSALDRTFSLTRALDWSGRTWRAGDRVAVRWFDAARLHAALGETSRLILPEVAGWDLVSLPPPGPRLGFGEEALLRYLWGDGPAPHVSIDVSRSGRTLDVSFANRSPFVSAVSRTGNWIEVAVLQGTLVVDGRGSFDAVVLGSRQGGQWRPLREGVGSAVRFQETYLAPFEELRTGRIRLSSIRSRYRVRWQLQLSSGEVVSGPSED